ncbi:MAG: Unknown protein [uncultured Sulfurovum sp.]|uniref:Uncharacterized protein n=1 Tax=uncultured Sulfurovum sp. TaxID=269237 RepID=A0A6S6SKA4_9BACT|nr:MAG: Unknown protein [uncultured Sulfurovum sp.]
MGGALFAFISFLALATITIQYKIDTEQYQSDIVTKRGYLNNGMYANEDMHTYSFPQTPQMNTPGTSTREEHVTNPIEQVELLETVILRTCRRLNVYAKKLGCVDAQSEQKLWKFIGEKGTTGTLEEAWRDGAETTAVSCATLPSFGRYLIRRAIPLNMIINTEGKHTYDLTGMQGNFLTSTDPCGYKEIIGWKAN